MLDAFGNELSVGDEIAVAYEHYKVVEIVRAKVVKLTAKTVQWAPIGGEAYHDHSDLLKWHDKPYTRSDPSKVVKFNSKEI